MMKERLSKDHVGYFGGHPQPMETSERSATLTLINRLQKCGFCVVYERSSTSWTRFKLNATANSKVTFPDVDQPSWVGAASDRGRLGSRIRDLNVQTWQRCQRSCPGLGLGSLSHKDSHHFTL